MNRSQRVVVVIPRVGPRRAIVPRIVFSNEEQQAHLALRTPVWTYIRQARLSVILTAPLIYLCLVPFVLLDIAMSAYQAVCFPIYGIPKVQAADYFIFDRSKLLYLNSIERLNCACCSYANGLIAYAGEIAGRTEQYWCPIKHAHQSAAPHSRYQQFLPFGDASAYRDQSEGVRRHFRDLNR